MNNIVQNPSRQAKKPFILSDFQENSYSKFTRNPNEYAKSLSKKMRAVFMYLFRFRYKDGILLSNTVVAHMVGCTTRTVARATRRFHDDGVILKHHRDTYALNRYYFHPILIESPGSFSLWFKTVTPTQKESYWEQGISALAKKQEKFVTPNLDEDNKGKMTQDSWDDLPLSVRIGASTVPVYGLSRDRNSLNGKDDGWSGFSRPYNDIVSEEDHRNGACTFCFQCYKELTDCDLSGGHDKKLEDPNIH